MAVSKVFGNPVDGKMLSNTPPQSSCSISCLDPFTGGIVKELCLLEWRTQTLALGLRRWAPVVCHMTTWVFEVTSLYKLTQVLGCAQCLALHHRLPCYPPAGT
mmetsp:Transcript_135545/g.239641  ORF Transcript_135545/g.239641 Transcript_135545/m.239641 type:complete len:103 (-) Transcript_135545:10-318(-)